MTLRFLLCIGLIGGSLTTGCAPTWTSTITYSDGGAACGADDPLCRRPPTRKTVKRPGRCRDAGQDLGPAASCTDKKDVSAGNTALAVVGLILLLPFAAASQAKS
jgi:hypothetical protein